MVCGAKPYRLECLLPAMNDLVRSMIFLTGIAAGLLAGFVHRGSPDDDPILNTAGLHGARAETDRTPFREQVASEGGEPATPDSERLAAVIAKYEALTAALQPGNGEALVMNFRKEADFWQIPGLIHAAAERDPVGCWRALLKLEAVNRCNSICWEALFSRWMVMDPRTAVQRLLDLPDIQTRSEIVPRVFAALKAASASDWDSIVEKYGRQVAEACGPYQEVPDGIQKPRYPQRAVPQFHAELQPQEQMSAYDLGSAAARSMAVRSPSGALTPADFRHAAGSGGTETLDERMRWLAAQPQLAARMALVELAAEYRSISPDMIADKELRRAVISRAAVAGAGFPDHTGSYRRWLQELAPADRSVAAEALRMDASLSDPAQTAALKMIDELGK